LDLILSSDEEQVAAAAADFLAGGPHPATAPAAAVRSQLAELGWFGLDLSPELGGAGLTCTEEMLVFREIGRALGPTLLLPMCLGARIAAAGDPLLGRELLNGQVGVCLVHPESELVFDVGGAGGAARVFDFESARLGLVSLPHAAYLLDLSQQARQSISCLDPSIPMATVLLRNAPVVAQLTGSRIEQLGRLATAAMLVGIAEKVLESSVEYAKVRVTFGKPIGSYQAVRHPCAEMAVRCEIARAQLFAAAISVRDAAADRALQVDAAKVVANQAALANVDSNIQLHGGIGITAEHSAHRYMKRAQVLARWFGSERKLLDTIAAHSRSGASKEEPALP
jgi:alkylation response protein AidB-like acyl-CoA dehydrogenase